MCLTKIIYLWYVILLPYYGTPFRRYACFLFPQVVILGTAIIQTDQHNKYKCLITLARTAHHLTDNCVCYILYSFYPSHCDF